MKALSLSLVCVLLAGAALAAEPGAIRPLDAIAAETFAAGCRRSDTFRELAGSLASSDVIVHVLMTRHLPSQIVGATRFVGHRGPSRYVRIELSASLSPKARIAVLGHELQHAREIADSGARTMRAVETFYRSSGSRAPTLRDGWETAEAAAIERQVWLELGGRADGAVTVE